MKLLPVVTYDTANSFGASVSRDVFSNINNGVDELSQHNPYLLATIVQLIQDVYSKNKELKEDIRKATTDKKVSEIIDDIENKNMAILTLILNLINSQLEVNELKDLFQP